MAKTKPNYLRINRAVSFFSVLTLISSPSLAAPLYNITHIGLTDNGQTNSRGRVQSNTAHQLNEAGQAMGSATRTNGITSMGLSAWFYDGSRTVEIGLMGSDYMRADGYQANRVNDLNEAGQIMGTTDRYNGTTTTGLSAWLYDGNRTMDISLSGSSYSNPHQLNEAGQVMGTALGYNNSGGYQERAWFYNGHRTIDIGLTGSAHTGDRGVQKNSVGQLNEAGQVSGHAQRYNGGIAIGFSAWIYDGSNTIEVGLTGNGYIRDDGYQNNTITHLNEAGHVIGIAGRYQGATNRGGSAWFYDGSHTTEIGLTGHQHTRGDGFQTNGARQLNQAGQVIGVANRYQGAMLMGVSAWFYDGHRTTEIGLTDNPHTRDDGYRGNVVNQLNNAGQVTGIAERYHGAIINGQSVWFYEDGHTTEIGLTGRDYTGDNGYQFNNVNQLNEAGEVTGIANRYYNDGNLERQSAWFFNGSTTTEIGLTGIDLARDGTYRLNETVQLNEAGQVVGYGILHHHSVGASKRAWFYDPELDQTFSHDFSIRPSDNVSFSHSEYLSEDGLMLGYYQKFDSHDNYLGDYAFSFTLEDGFLDLALLVEGFDDTDWLSLASAISSNRAGQIMGKGEFYGMLGSAYLLTPQASAVPVPAAVWLLGSGFIGLLGWAKRTNTPQRD